MLEIVRLYGFVYEHGATLGLLLTRCNAAHEQCFCTARSNVNAHRSVRLSAITSQPRLAPASSGIVYPQLPAFARGIESRLPPYAAELVGRVRKVMGTVVACKLFRT